MRRLIFVMVSLVIVVLSAAIVGGVQAAQNHAPQVLFGTRADRVDRAALSQRRVRIPVTWEIENRPLLANLYFEQILPDGSAINVELPRLFFWVPSVGEGVVAPVEPPESAGQIVLRLSLRDLFGPRVYAQSQFSLPVMNTGDPGTDAGNVPFIARFVADASDVPHSQLASGAVRIPVEWEVMNRPFLSNLVFEEVLESGSSINVELPRANPWVGSSGTGVVAPRLPGSGEQMRLRLRLVDVLTRRVYDQRDVLVRILDDTHPPRIDSFVSSAQGIHASALRSRTARIPVSWSVTNRPPGSNLVFEQRTSPTGGLYNVELPRPDPIVPSSGSGVVSPAWPGDNQNHITLVLRVVDLNSAATLTSAELVVPIIRDDAAAAWQSGDVCLQEPYAGGNGTVVGSVGRVLDGIGIDSLPVRGQPNGDVIGLLPVGAVFEVLNGPACWQIQTFAPADQYEFRVWLVQARASSLTGWIEEYGRRSAGSAFYYYELIEEATPAPAVIHHFAAEPMVADREAVITLSWEVSSAERVNLQAVRPNGQFGQWFTGLPLAGAVEYRLPEENTEMAQFLLSAEDAQGRQLATQTLTVTVRCPFSETYYGCPLTQTEIQAAYQTFERGTMIWRGDLRQIVVLYDNGTYQTFSDTWTEGDPVDTGETPRPGLILPARGFGKVWAQQPGVRDRIGWATSAETSYRARVEMYLLPRRAPASAVLNLPDGRLLSLGEVWEIR